MNNQKDKSIKKKGKKPAKNWRIFSLNQWEPKIGQITHCAGDFIFSSWDCFLSFRHIIVILKMQKTETIATKMLSPMTTLHTLLNNVPSWFQQWLIVQDKYLDCISTVWPTKIVCYYLLITNCWHRWKHSLFKARTCFAYVDFIPCDPQKL